MRLWPRRKVYVDNLPKTHDLRFMLVFVVGLAVIFGSLYAVGYAVAGDKLPNGTRVDVVVENVTLSCAIVRGGISGDVPRYQLAGRPEWGAPIKPRPYQNTIVLRSTVCGDCTAPKYTD